MSPALGSFETLWRMSKAWPGVVVAAVTASVLAVWVTLSLRLEAPAVGVLRVELQSHEGRLYRLGEETIPFTGTMIECYDSGLLKSRSTISNGVLHGVSEGWHTNGQMQVREHFKEGVSHGLRTRWHENGAKMSEGMIIDGKLQGRFRRWYDNGKLAEQMELKQDHPDGLARSYYPSGFLKAQARLKDGQVTEQQFWKDGELSGVSAAEVTN